ncbi:hypothetical protein [Falsiroseomonas sp. HW251]|uniref:hypothetical protein n=1 Tax=Falsiroseomonas sp. HW251 TaxID=3390998 RepID=UPI003D314243
MRAQPGMLVLLGEAPDCAAADLLRAGHLPLHEAMLSAALTQGGSAAVVARRLAAQCDAVAGRAAGPLQPLLRSLRRPVYASHALVPPARALPADRVPPWCDLRLLLAASRALDR